MLNNFEKYAKFVNLFFLNNTLEIEWQKLQWGILSLAN